MRLTYILTFLPFALGAPLLTAPRDAEAIPGSYIVKLKSSASKAHLNAALALLSSKPAHSYDFGTFKGFAGKLSDAVVKKLQALDAVEYIQEDSILRAPDYTVTKTKEKRAFPSQSPAPWNLVRISHRALGGVGYVYDASAGTGTCSYVIDSGVYVQHPEFEGRATWVANLIDSSNTDDNGHGTHIAGIMGAKTYGVAKKTTLLAIKIFGADGSTTNSVVIAGINRAVSDAQTRSCPKGAVINLSVLGAKSTALNSAVASAVAKNVFVAVAAGSSNANDIANYSPASEPTACTTGATDSADNRASFSSYGSLIDIWAPGVSIISTWVGGGTNTISGTSLASPHIAGLGAYLMSLEGVVGSKMCARIYELSTKNILHNIPSGTVNALAYNGATGP